ncbi:MAG TPA: hypothetical protein PLD23_10595 [Armatimonadota bacterium]|nr:hypothetical protein [Armatimonadota bacterium]
MKRLMAMGLALIVASTLLLSGCKSGGDTGPGGKDVSGEKGKAMMKEALSKMGKTALPGDPGTGNTPGMGKMTPPGPPETPDTATKAGTGE